MPFRLFARFILPALVLLAGLGSARGAVAITGLPTGGNGGPVPANIPAGKVLILPLSAYEDGGGQPTITVTSSNPNIFARVRTGNPLLRLKITHTGAGTASNPTYSGDLVFQLFNDWTPFSARYVAGFAASGFYENKIFHRLANLHEGLTGVGDEFIFQGGGYISGDTKLLGAGGPGFSYDNEYAAPLIYAGRGQLALANAGFDSSYHGSNGSQFFITDSLARDLDFRFTILGQLTHGWELLDGLRATPRGTADTAAGDKLKDRPLSDVTITESAVIPRYTAVDSNGISRTYTDAVLLLSANRAGTATITVKATYGSQSITTSFTATAAKETVNSPPFFVPQGDTMTKGLQAAVPFRAVDLEYDHVDVGAQLVNVYSNVFSQKGSFLPSTTPNTFVVAGNAKYVAGSGSNAVPYAGALQPVASVSQWHPGYRPGYDATPPDVDGYYAPNVIVGTAPVTGDPMVINGAPGVALTNVIVAAYTDAAQLAKAGSLTATINWGDGTNVASTGSVAASTAPGGYHTMNVLGSNLYNRPGTYPIVVTLKGSTGWTKLIYSTAVITANALKALPAEDITNTGAAVVVRQLASFTDTNAPAPATGYVATIDWGDGVLGPATIRATGPGKFNVYGTHGYRDPEPYSVAVRIHKNGQDANLDALVYTRIRPIGFVGPAHLPPFSQAKLTGVLEQAPVDPTNSNTALYPLKVIENGQTYITCQLSMANSGNLPTAASTLRVYLARGTTIQKTPILDSQGHVVTPADVPLAFGPLLPMGSTMQVQTSVPIKALAPGERLTYTFKKQTAGDYRLRLPAGETGTGYNLIAELQNADPLVALEGTPLPIIGRIQGIVVTPTTLSTTELGGSATFKVSLDRAPKADVTIPITGDSTEGTISPTSLTFTSSNWKTPQVVTVTGIPDSALPRDADTDPNNNDDPDPDTDVSTTQYLVRLEAATSADPLYNGLIGPVLLVSNADRDNNITVAASPGSLPAATSSASTAPRLSTAAVASATNHFGTVTLTFKKVPTSPVSVEILFSSTANGVISAFNGITPENPTFTVSPSDFTNGSTTLTKTFHIEAKQDPANAGKQIAYTVAFLAHSEDPNFGGITPAPLTVTNTNSTAP